MFLNSASSRLGLLLLCLLCSGGVIRAQSFTQQFDALVMSEKPDSLQIRNLLRLWQRVSPEDPQLYVAAFNYGLSQSRTDAGVVSGADATGEAASHAGYDFRKVSNAIAWIDQGLMRNPNRLDMWFGKAHALRLTHQFDSFLVVMQRVLDRSVVNRNAWEWTNGKKLDSGRRFMLSTMHTYLRELYETDRQGLLPLMSKLGEAIIRVYPEEVEILTTTSVSLLLQQRYSEAVVYLKRAEHARPRDVVVLNNLAEAYRLMGDKPLSLHYLKLVEAWGSTAEKEQARKQMKALKR